MLPSHGRTEFSPRESAINFSTLYILGPSDLRFGGGGAYQIIDLINIDS